MPEWYAKAHAPERGIWWAVEHRGHPAFYLRTLMPGDFASGRLPLPRHVLELGGTRAHEIRCGTCHEVPQAGDLEPIERATGDRGHLAVFRTGRRPWPQPTDQGRCWQCGAPPVDVTESAVVDGSAVKVCRICAAHLAEGRI